MTTKQPSPTTQTVNTCLQKPTYCHSCHQPIIAARAVLGYDTCLTCGEAEAKQVKHTIVPLTKSNYIVVSDLELLKGLNKYAQT